jgi:hypothetical protein
LASREVPVTVGLRLFLPESWTDDPERMARAGVGSGVEIDFLGGVKFKPWKNLKVDLG